MVLGAGPSQVPFIRRAVAAGAHVITVDYLPGNPGHRLSHQSVDCSTVDRDAVLRAARDLRIDGITTFASDVATATVAFVARGLGLPGPPCDATNTMSDKATFRAFQHTQRSLHAPAWVAGSDAGRLLRQIRALAPPLVFKPVDASGSRGVTRVDVADDAAYSAAFARAAGSSRSATVCVEEFVEGINVSGDGFVADGRLLAVVTRKYLRGLTPIGHRVPCDLPALDEQRVLEQVAAHCRCLGYRDGPLDFDAIVAEGGTTVIEMSPRLGGNGIPQLIEHATGLDLIGLNVDYALGLRRVLPTASPVPVPCASLIIGSEIAGIVESIAQPDDLRYNVPAIFDCDIRARVGDRVPGFVHGGDSLGQVLFDCAAPCDYLAQADRITKALHLVVR